MIFIYTWIWGPIYGLGIEGRKNRKRDNGVQDQSISVLEK